MHVIEGLRDGKIGLIAKLHHAAIDGVSGVQLMAQLLDVTPDVPAPIVGKEPWRPPALPSGARMLTQAVPQLLTSPLRALRAAREVGRTAFRMAFHSGDGGTDSVSIPVGAPAQFCAPITARRSLSFAEANLTDVLALKDHLGVTLNDVVLAACSGAMRSYLSDHDQETTESLVAVVPVSLRHDSEGDALGNRLSAMFIPLGSDQEEPLDRLDSVVTACDSAKVQERSVGYGDMASAVSDAILPAVAGPALRLGAQLGAVRRLRPANVVISNVPGPRFPMYFAGMRMEEVYPIGPVVEGVGLNITVQTYLDSLFIGLNACPKVVPDVESLARAIVLELGNLMRDASSSRPRVREPQLVNEDVPRKSSVPKHTAPTPKALVATVGSHQTRHRVTSATR
jgi:WS/DGAT/MGAT family acyltransferase